MREKGPGFPLYFCACVATLSLACTDPVSGAEANTNPLADKGQSPSDAGTQPEDATPPPKVPSCDASQPFDRVDLAAGLATPANEGDVRFTADELTVVISRYNGYGEMPIAVASRSSKEEPFGKPAYLALSPGAARASISADGHTLFFQAQVYDKAAKTLSFDLFRVDRKDSKTSFENEKAMATLNSAKGYEGEVFLPPGGKSLYFVSNLGGNADIHSALAKDSNFAEVEKAATAPFAQVNTADAETKPTLSADELTIYYSKASRARPKTDIWVATRASVNEPFGPGRAVAELNTDGDELPSWLSPDNCRLYLISDRPGGPGSGDVYVASRQPR